MAEADAAALARARAAGQAHGRAHRPAIRALARARLAGLRSRAGAAAVGKLSELAATLEAAASREQAELAGVAEGSELERAELLALDGGVVEVFAGGGIERSLSLYVTGPRGPVLAGAFALPASEAEQLRLWPLASEGGPAGQLLGLPGGIGLAGVAPSGFAVVANLLRPASSEVGLPGGLALRRLLRATSLDEARSQLEATSLVGGRSWMLADGRSFLGFEQLGASCVLTRIGAKTGHVHANHCFDPALRQREARPRSPASFRRLELASTLYVQQRPDGADAVFAYFDAVEQAAFPRFSDGERAETLWAVELHSGRGWLRRRAGQAVERFRFATPFAELEEDLS